MRVCWRVWFAAGLVSLPIASYAATCTTQAELLALDRDALVAAGGRLSMAILQQDEAALHAALLPVEAAIRWSRPRRW